MAGHPFFYEVRKSFLTKPISSIVSGLGKDPELSETTNIQIICKHKKMYICLLYFSVIDFPKISTQPLLECVWAERQFF